VRHLEEAGYTDVGKANLHEFAYGITSENPHFGTVPNPAAPGRIAGGSSGGSAAAIAAGLADAALGSDSGGSIRIPAACCGVVGFKPTHRLVPLDGCFPLAPSFDTAGPMGPDVATCAAMMAALTGTVPAALDSLDEVRAGLAWTSGADRLVGERVEAAGRLFARRRAVDWRLAGRVATRVFMREAATSHEGIWPGHRSAYGDDVAYKLERCFAVTDADYAAGMREREAARERFAELMEDLDLLVTPTIRCVAPPVGLGDLALRDSLLAFTYPFNVVGAPALALPCGPAEDGLPASVQLVGKPGDDALVLGAGLALEGALRATQSRASG
jgi:aspartyl-tRNA(Asn)/glutamyl-tRNA(Gln) amidotransferase subunit A